MRSKNWILAAVASAALGGLAWAELRGGLESVYEPFRQGRLEEAEASLRAAGAQTPEERASLAILLRERGLDPEVMPLWEGLSAWEGSDGFIHNQLAWTCLRTGRSAQARESFLKAIERSTTTASQAEANLGLGIQALLESKPKAAMAPLRSALVQGPYVLPAASFQTALTALSLGERTAALAFLRQSFELDPANLEALKELSRLLERLGEKRSAWRLRHRVLALDPGDPESARRFAKLSASMSGDTEVSLGIRRLSRPLLDPQGQGALPPSASTRSARVALFAGKDGRPSALTSLRLRTNSPFSLTAGGETLLREEASLEAWEISWRAESGLVEVRDPARNIRYAARASFRIVPAARLGSVLIQGARLTPAPSGLDRGDRELRGSLEVIPGPQGLLLVNELPLEDYLYGAVGAALPQASPLEAYKAQAVLSRTKALWAMAQAGPEGGPLCDSPHCQRYLGASSEMRQASEAVAATEGMVLTLEGRPARVLAHENCGGITEDGGEAPEGGLAHLASVPDGPWGVRLQSPLALERWTHEFPPRQAYCAGGLPPAQSRWIRLLETRELERRAGRWKQIGAIRRLRAQRRTATGRILALEVVGSRASLTLEGETAISDLLSPGSLRSTLLTIQPLGKGPSHFILWGAGTGSGLGMCLAGAVGQASLGRDWRQILAHYFARLAVEKFW